MPQNIPTHGLLLASNMMASLIASPLSPPPPPPQSLVVSETERQAFLKTEVELAATKQRCRALAAAGAGGKPLSMAGWEVRWKTYNCTMLTILSVQPSNTSLLIYFNNLCSDC